MNFNSGTRLLVVSAHPDDEVLGCGATLARAVQQGAKVAVLFLGEGISARFPLGEYNSSEFHDQTLRRNNGAIRALKVLGVECLGFGTRLCTQFDTLPLTSIVKEIEIHMEAWKPTILFTHNPSEVNLDHRLTYQAVEVACRPTRAWIPTSIYTFEIICSGNWKFDSAFVPNVYVDVTKHWQTKIKAWECYEGEDRAFPFPRSVKGLETLAQFRGMAAGVNMAEAFRLVRCQV